MSSEVKLRQKLNKKIKLAFGKAKNHDESKLKARSTAPHKEARGGGNAVRRNHKLLRGGRDQVDDHDASESNVGQRRNHDPANFDRKGRRVYANQDLKMTSHQNVYASAKRELTEAKNGVEKRKLSGQPPRSIWISTRKEDVSSKSKHAGPKFKKRIGSVEEYDGKSTKLRVNDHRNHAVTGMLNRHAIINEESGTVPEKKRRTRFGDATPQSTVKKVWKGKAMADDELEDRPKKKKRVIRLDPFDISNKRLDDGLATIGSSREMKKELEANVEISKNAQFRAIKPSASILSYVEDNLLGRRRSIELKRAGYNIELSAPLDNIPFSTSSERERIEDSVFRNKLNFFAAAKVSSSFPPPDLPEIAFAGRSNVGKSSLLNSLTRQWGVARTSDKPGLTQTINFFELGKLCLVDLPGYGFAYAKEEVKDAWEDLVKEYVSTRVGLKRVCLLVDTKWGMKPRDLELIHLMERSQTKYQVVLTKTDLVFPMDVARRAMQIEETLKANKSLVQPVVMVSSKTGAGIRCLRAVLSKITRFAKV